jgi:hypothetical protein
MRAVGAARPENEAPSIRGEDRDIVRPQADVVRQSNLETNRAGLSLPLTEMNGGQESKS